jgi:hypothetical protein
MSPLIAVDLITFAVLVFTWVLAPMRTSGKVATVGQSSAPSLSQA